MTNTSSIKKSARKCGKAAEERTIYRGRLPKKALDRVVGRGEPEDGYCGEVTACCVYGGNSL